MSGQIVEVINESPALLEGVKTTLSSKGTESEIDSDESDEEDVGLFGL